MDWHPAADRDFPGKDAGGYVGGPWRLVLHTTEGYSIEGAVAAYRKHGGWPHMTVDLARTRIAQHIPFTRAARALQNDRGGVETNRYNAIQVEIVGTASESPHWRPERLDFLGKVLSPVVKSFSIPLVAPDFVGPEAGWIAREDAPQRMSFDEWRRYSGVCGHQHVPENDHWDPGNLDVDRVLVAAGRPPANVHVHRVHYGQPLEVEVQIVPVHLEIPTDGNGKGWTKVKEPVDRIIGYLPHSEVRPGHDGFYDTAPNEVHFTPEGDGTLVVVQGEEPNGVAHVWLRVAA